MQENPGITALKVFVAGAIIFFIALNTFSINRMEQQRMPAGADHAGDGSTAGSPLVRQYADGTVETRGVVILPNGVVIVPEGQTATIYLQNGRVVPVDPALPSDGNGSEARSSGTD